MGKGEGQQLGKNTKVTKLIILKPTLKTQKNT